MKYSSVNNLQDFEFHDSQMEFISYADGKLVVAVKHLNIHKATLQNDFETDMEIALAQITFEGLSVKSFELSKAEKANIADRISAGEKAEQKYISELKHGINIFEFGLLDSGFYYIDACGVEPWFTVQFSFENVTVEWEEYSQKAWYEK